MAAAPAPTWGHVRRGGLRPTLCLNVWKGVVADREIPRAGPDWFPGAATVPHICGLQQWHGLVSENINASRGDGSLPAMATRARPAKDFALLTQCTHHHDHWDVRDLGRLPRRWRDHHLANYTLPDSSSKSLSQRQPSARVDWDPC